MMSVLTRKAHVHPLNVSYYGHTRHVSLRPLLAGTLGQAVCAMQVSCVENACWDTKRFRRRSDARYPDSRVWCVAAPHELAPASPLLALPQPDKCYQQQPGTKEILALRAIANTAAKDKTLINVQVGRQGVTPTFLAGAMDVLQAHQYVRVRLGDGCGLERSQAAGALATLLDAVCVHQVGFTITLYRQKGLPRPSNCTLNHAAVSGGKGKGTEGVSEDVVGVGKEQVGPVQVAGKAKKRRGGRAASLKAGEGRQGTQSVATGSS